MDMVGYMGMLLSSTSWPVCLGAVGLLGMVGGCVTSAVVSGCLDKMVGCQVVVQHVCIAAAAANTILLLLLPNSPHKHLCCCLCSSMKRVRWPCGWPYRWWHPACPHSRCSCHHPHSSSSSSTAGGRVAAAAALLTSLFCSRNLTLLSWGYTSTSLN